MIKKENVFVLGLDHQKKIALGQLAYVLDYCVTGSPLEGFDTELISTLSPDMLRQTAWQFMPSRIKQYGWFQDTPWFIFNPPHEQILPNTKFIVLAENPQLWMQDLVKQYKKQALVYQEWASHPPPNASKPSQPQTLDQYIFKTIDLYFENQLKNVLILNVNQPIPWDTLCSFLGHTMPAIQLPLYTNRRDEQRKTPSWKNWLEQSLKISPSSQNDKRDTFFATLRLKEECQQTLRSIEAQIFRSLSKQGDSLHALTLIDRVTRDVLGDIGMLKGFLSVEKSSIHLNSVANFDSAKIRWDQMAQDLRHLVGSLQENDIDLIEPDSQRDVALLIQNACNKLSLMGKEISSLPNSECHVRKKVL